jgi:FAD:protein FMN transferase
MLEDAAMIRCHRRAAPGLLALAGVALGGCSPAPPALQGVTGFAQGTTYSLQWSGPADAKAVAAAADAELERLDRLLSNYREDSTLEKFNASRSADPRPLPAELVALLRIAQRVHGESRGCFDPTVRPLVHAWGFDTDEPHVPSEPSLAAARASVGLDKLVIVDDEHVRKVVPTLALDMSSIGQGYSADRLADVLEHLGARAYLAEIGGEMVARGAKPDGSAWRIGVERPNAEDGAIDQRLRLPREGRVATVTSGTYRHYFEAENRHLSHIIDPRTGWPVDHALQSVTVLGREGATAAAWGTALLCLGPEDASLTAERLGIAALLWVEHTPNAFELHRTSALDADWPGVLE